MTKPLRGEAFREPSEMGAGAMWWVRWHGGLDSIMPNEETARACAAVAGLVEVCQLAIMNEKKADELRDTGIVDAVDIRALRAIANAARSALAAARVPQEPAP